MYNVYSVGLQEYVGTFCCTNVKNLITHFAEQIFFFDRSFIRAEKGWSLTGLTERRMGGGDECTFCRWRGGVGSRPLVFLWTFFQIPLVVRLHYTSPPSPPPLPPPSSHGEKIKNKQKCSAGGWALLPYDLLPDNRKNADWLAFGHVGT